MIIYKVESTNSLFLCSAGFVSCAPPLPTHEGCFLEDKRVIAGGLGDSRLGRVHEGPRGVFNPVEEGVQFDALVEILKAGQMS